jgi:hypothetical protein
VIASRAGGADVARHTPPIHVPEEAYEMTVAERLRLGEEE